MNIEIPELSELMKRLETVERHNSDLKSMVQLLIDKLLPKAEAQKYKVNDLVAMYKVSRQTVYNWNEKGLRYEQVGKRRYILKTDLENWLEKNNRILNKLMYIKEQAKS